MEDREFLIWLHERLENVHGENHLVDYMHKLRAIIGSYPKDKETTTIDENRESLKELIMKKKYEDMTREDLIQLGEKIIKYIDDMIKRRKRGKT